MNVVPVLPEPEVGTLQCAWGQSDAFFRRDWISYPSAKMRFGKAEGNKLCRKQALASV